EEGRRCARWRYPQRSRAERPIFSALDGVRDSDPANGRCYLRRVAFHSSRQKRIASDRSSPVQRTPRLRSSCATMSPRSDDAAGRSTCKSWNSVDLVCSSTSPWSSSFMSTTSGRGSRLVLYRKCTLAVRSLPASLRSACLRGRVQVVAPHEGSTKQRTTLSGSLDDVVEQPLRRHRIECDGF